MVQPDAKYVVPLKKPYVYYDANFLDPATASTFYQDLLTATKWETTSKINRWVSLHYNNDTDENDNDQQQQQYQYRDAPGAPQIGFSPTIQRIQEAAQQWYLTQTGIQVEFNVCLLNYYENGQQRIGWHSDREEIGRSTPIASVSLGATRPFHIRNKTQGPTDRVSLDLGHGSLIVMENQCQHEYLHSIPRQSQLEEGRINLTFRCKTFTTDGELLHEQRDQGLAKITQDAIPSSQAWSSSSSGGIGNSEGSTNNMTRAGSAFVFGDNVMEDELDPDYPKIQFLLKTNLGTERYCAAEAQELLLLSHNNNKTNTVGGVDLTQAWKVVARPLGWDGFVAICRGDDDDDDNDDTGKRRITTNLQDETIRILLGMKSALHLMEFHAEFAMEDVGSTASITTIPVEKVTGEMLYEYFKAQLVQKQIVIESLEQLAKTGGGTFRASCDRIGGPHAFTHPEVEREMGGAIAEYYEEAKITPKMEDYDVCIRMEVMGYRILVGTQLNVSDLSKDRHFLKFRNAVAVKTNIAYAMVRLGNIRPGHTVLDPFCGSGTLLLEALEVYQKQIFAIGLDVSRRSAEGARENALAEMCGPEHCRFACSDARGLRKHVEDESVDAIITNLPWGVQTGQHNSVTELATLHEIFLRTAWYTLKPGGRIVMLNLRGLQLMRIVRKLGGRFRLLSVNVIRTTNNLPSIFVIEKLASDALRDSIKNQLAHLSQYVTVGPEMYQALHSEAIEED